MDAKSPALAVIYSPTALDELDEIWDWNLEHNGFNQAQAYRQFLLENINSLAVQHNSGRTVATRSDLRFILMKWSTSGYGHVAVYQVDAGAATVTIAHVFHTSQNWRQKLKQETRA